MDDKVISSSNLYTLYLVECFIVNSPIMSCWQKYILYLMSCFILTMNLGGRSVFAQSTTPTVSCQLAAASIAVGGWTELSLTVENAVDFYGYELKLFYNPELVEIRDGDAVRDGVNAQLGNFVKLDLLEFNDNVRSDQLWLKLMQIAPTAALSGSGELATVLLQGRINGTAEFSINDLFLYDINGAEIPYNVKNCSLQIAGDPVPTPTVTAVAPTAIETSSPTPSATATLVPTPSATMEPLLAAPTATAIAQTETIFVTPTATAILAAPPTATPLMPVETSGVVNLESATPAPTPVDITSLSTPPLVPTSLPLITTTIETAMLAPSGVIAPSPSVSRLFLPYISIGSTQTGQPVEVTTAGAPPPNQLEPTSLSFPGAQPQPKRNASGIPAALARLPFGILLLAGCAIGAIVFELLLLITYILYVGQPEKRRFYAARKGSGTVNDPPRIMKPARKISRHQLRISK